MRDELVVRACRELEGRGASPFVIGEDRLTDLTPEVFASTSLVLLAETLVDIAGVRAKLAQAAPLAAVMGLCTDRSTPDATRFDEAGVPVADVSALRAVASLLEATGRREAAHHAALELVGASFTLLDPDGHTLVASRGGAALGLGVDGRPVDIVDEDMPEAADTPPRRLRVVAGEGSRPVQRRTAARPDGAKLIVHTDVSAQDTLERKLLAVGRSETASELARGVLHDLNNAFCVITSFTDLLLEEGEHNDALRKDLGEIARAGSKAASLTSKLVLFSKGGPVRTDVVDLCDFLRKSEALFRRIVGEQLELAVELKAVRASAVCDPGELELVVAGLVRHAKDAAGPGGLVTVTVTEPPEAAIVAVAASTAAGLEAAVLPDGPVAETEAAEGFAQRFGGRFVRVGGGAALHLPPAPHRRAAQPVPRARATDRGPETVLIVEDDASVRAAMSRVLGSIGYRVLEAARPADAEPLAPEADIVLADLVLPGGRGTELVTSLRRARPELPALIVTGYGAEAEAESPSIGVVRKPFSAADLARRVRQAIDGK
jgi:hypothetical protein